MGKVWFSRHERTERKQKKPSTLQEAIFGACATQEGPCVLRGLASIVPSSLTMPTATLFADPSIPRASMPGYSATRRITLNLKAVLLSMEMNKIGSTRGTSILGSTFYRSRAGTSVRYDSNGAQLLLRKQRHSIICDTHQRMESAASHAISRISVRSSGLGDPNNGWLTQEGAHI